MTIKINYKGTSSRGINYIYRCGRCGEEQAVTHPAIEEPIVACKSCDCECNKKPAAPALDADHHDSMRSHNIGWEQ